MLGVVGLYILWVLPSPLLGMISTGGTRYLGLLGPMVGRDVWIINIFAFGTRLTWAAEIP